MPRSSGTYTLPAGNPVTTGTTITSTWANTTLSDIATALTGSVATDGTSPMTGILQMGNNKITGVANGTASSDVATVFQIANPNITGGTIDGAPIGASNPKNGAFLALSATSASLTGTCTATTVTPGTDNSTKIATTAFVQSAIASVSSGVTSFNTRSGAVTLTSSDVTTALGYTPYNSSGATVITTANYNTYTPTLTGTGASGTWGISISGNAATASTATTAVNVSGTVAIANGGTGQTTKATAFNALSPITTSGDLIIGNGTNSNTRLGVGSTGQVLTVVAGAPAWAAGGNGTVTSVAMTVPSFLSVTGSPITSSGTLAISLSGTALPVANGGTGSTTLAGAGIAQLSGATFTGAVVGQYTAAVTAAGTSQGTATSINADTIYVSGSSATSAPYNGVILPSGAFNRKITIYNNSSNPIYIYPPSSGFLDNQSSNIPIQIEAGKQITITCVSVPNIWYSNYYNGLTSAGLQSYAKTAATDGKESQIKITSYDGTNTGAKTIRVSTFGDVNGTLEIIDKAYSTSLLTVQNNGDFSIASSSATKPSGTTWANPSDVRLKDNIQDYTNGIDKLMQVQPKTWEYNGKGGTTAGVKGLGVIANEIEQVLPNTVDTYSFKLNAQDNENTNIKRFDATEITWLLVNAVKELKVIVDAQAAEIAALKG